MKPRSLPIRNVPQKIGQSLSALVPVGANLWLGADEGTALAQALTNANSKKWKHAATHDLVPLLDLPGKTPDDEGNLPEVDAEGLAWDGQHLWVVGSHSLKRKQPKTDKKESKNFERLAKVEADGNRYLLGRIPLDSEGRLLPAAEAATADHCAARLPCDIAGSDLIEALRSDPLFARNLQGKVDPTPGTSEIEQIEEKRKQAEKRNLPGKDNGFDIEGLAALGPDHLLVGLRGPVLRGWAIVLELKLTCEKAPGGDKPGVLGLQNVGDQPYRILAFELGGLGIRDLCYDKESGDLLILAGPTMVLPWPTVVFSWKGAKDKLARDQDKHFIWNPALHTKKEMDEGKDSIWDSELTEAFRYEPRSPGDRAESLCVLYTGTERRLVIGYDNPDRWSEKDGGTLLLDSFPFA